MTFKEIRHYAVGNAMQFARLINEGAGAKAQRVEDAVIAKAMEHIGGNFHPERKQQYLAKTFTLACRAQGVSTRVIHLCKNGEAK